MAAENKTRPTEVGVDDFLAAVPDAQRREDARALRAMMERLSGAPAVMWGPSIVGFGTCHYKYESGREGDMPRIGFSPRARELVLYVTSGFPGERQIIARLGKHKTGKSCVYVKRLSDIDPEVLEEWIIAALAHLRERYPEGA